MWAFIDTLALLNAVMVRVLVDSLTALAPTANNYVH